MIRSNLLRIAVPLACFAAAASAATSGRPTGGLYYLGVWPHTILVMDEHKDAPVDKIQIKTGAPFNLILSSDKKKLYVTTIERSGIETIDLASRKLVDSFVLDSGGRRERLAAVAVDSAGKYLYSIISPAVKQIDSFDIEPAEFAVVDLAQHKIVRRVPFPKDINTFGVTGLFGAYSGGLKLSPDDKVLYLFHDNIYAFDTTDFKLVDTLNLAKPTVPGMATLALNLFDDAYGASSSVTSLFVSSDPIVHKPAFGLATVDLATRKFDFTPIGPYTSGLMELFLSPDRSTGYTVSITGQNGNRHTEFWVLDMNSKQIVQRAEFPGRRRFNFALSPSGDTLFIYVAGFEVDCYDAKTLKHTHTIDLGADVTTPNMIVIPN